MAPESPFTDPAAPILSGDPVLSDQNRADLWDVFYQSKDASEMAAHLQPLAIPEDTKRKLYLAKQTSTPVVAPLDKATSAIQKLATIDPEVLDLAETHPNVLKTLAAALSTPEGGAAGASGEGSAASKEKGSKTGKRTPTVTPDLPATPPGHALVQASDNGLHHIPIENIDKARAIDPKLQVLHVQE